MFIRYWAQTDASPTSLCALDYCRALLRYCPVRLVSLTGQLEGSWRVMDSLMSTPMAPDPMINVVCADQEHWVRTIDVGMPKSDTMHATIASGKPVESKVETFQHDRELWTKGVRNVLIARSLPTTIRYALAAAKYDAIVTTTHDIALAWTSNEASYRISHACEWFPAGAVPSAIPTPLTAMLALRTAVFGK